MKLQIALDDLALSEAMRLLEEIQDDIDIIELGTPFIMRYGMAGLKKVRRKLPDKEILADLKIMDAGLYEAEIALASGADYVTVLGVAARDTLLEAQEAATRFGKKVFVDLLCVEDLVECIHFVEESGIYGVSVHTGVDQQRQGRTALGDLQACLNLKPSCTIAVAGGINKESVGDYLDEGAEIIVVGSGVTKRENPVCETKMIAQKMRFREMIGTCG